MLGPHPTALWSVSIAFLIHRALDVGTISPNQTPATGTGACVVTVPSSLSARIKSDPRPKVNLLRVAFETHAPAVVSAHPPRPTPAIEGMQPTMVRREADEGDPFVNVLFKLRVNEKAGRPSMPRHGLHVGWPANDTRAPPNPPPLFMRLGDLG